MKPDVVVDVGNSRVKWGLCSAEGVERVASLTPDDPTGWARQAEDWELRPGKAWWVLTGVQPKSRDQLADWLGRRGDRVRLLTEAQELPLRVALEHPDRVGIDRLFDAVAAKDRVRREVAILIVDAGSAVTIDLVDEAGAFQGGVIFPGFRLMTKALHDYTALLPPVAIDRVNPPVPGNTTAGAIQAGVYWAVAGGIKAVLRQLAARCRWDATAKAMSPLPHDPFVFLTGGDAELLAPVLDPSIIVWPEMTLEGIRVAAEALPA